VTVEFIVNLGVWNVTMASGKSACCCCVGCIVLYSIDGLVEEIIVVETKPENYHEFYSSIRKHFQSAYIDKTSIGQIMERRRNSQCSAIL
jgi:hypothetical protein